MGVAAYGETLYYTDWMSTRSGTKGHIKSFDMLYGIENSVLVQGHQPTGLHYSPAARNIQSESKSLQFVTIS